MPGQYPLTVMEVVSDAMRFTTPVLDAVKAFARSRPWSGTLDERKEKFRQLNRDLAVVYHLPEPHLIFGRLNGSSSGQSYYDPSTRQIGLIGRLSVVTYLHEFAHVRGKNEYEATTWSVNLFKQVFPEQYARLSHRQHMLIRPADLRRREGKR